MEAQAHPAIIHFTGIPKPWYKNCKHPWKKEFDKYKAMSPWRDEKEKRWMPLKFCLEKMAIKLVVSMGLRKSDYICLLYTSHGSNHSQLGITVKLASFLTINPIIDVQAFNLASELGLERCV